MAWMAEGYAPEDVRVANATARSGGAIGCKPIVYTFAAKTLSKGEPALDFGAGPKAVHTLRLREEGFQVTAWDFGANFKEGLHDRQALAGKYEVVLASNVFNVLSQSAVIRAVFEIVQCLKPGGRVIWNFPVSPRKCPGVDEDFIMSEFTRYGHLTFSSQAHLFVSAVPGGQG